MITPQTTLDEIKKNEICRRLFPYFVFDASDLGAQIMHDGKTTLADIERINKTWSASDMAYGLNALVAQGEHEVEFCVYEPHEITEDPSIANVKLFCFWADEKRRQNKTVILASGGAYGAVCSIAEGFPVAARFAELGIDAFCLNYRVGAPAPLFPKPMDDMGAAVKFLLANADALGIHMENYAVGGFSAGGHLAACFGTKALGYARYGLPCPTAIVLNYPLTDIWGNIDPLPEPMRSVMLGGYFGEGFSRVIADQYNPVAIFDGEYPACFVAHATDDKTVPIRFTEVFVRELEKHSIEVEFLKAENGSHGYGLGSACAARGWVDHFERFWRKAGERK